VRVLRESRLKYHPALDGLRACAVLAVIAYHDGFGWARGGFLGVDTFFVLSGFLITSLLIAEWDATGRAGLGGFWARRARRLLPALLLLLLVVALYAAVIVPKNELRQLRGDGLASLFYVANWRFIFAGQSYFETVEFPSPLRHLWSLAIEEQFYLLWPLVVTGVLVVARRTIRFLTWLCVVGIAVSAGLMWFAYSWEDPSRAYYGTDTRAHTVLVGCALALILHQWSSRSAKSLAALRSAGVLAALGCLLAWHTTSDHASGYYHGGSLLFAVTIAVLIASVVQEDRNLVAAVLSVRPLRWIGKISYGLYLWHWPVQVFMTPLRTGTDGDTLQLLRLGTTFAFATLSYYLVEQPIRRGALRGLRAQLAALVAFATVGFVVVATTTGAVGLPAFLGGTATGFVPTLCPAPVPKVLHDAEQTRRRLAGDANEVSVPLRITVVGDSWACSLLPGLDAVAARDGASVSNAAVLGCGVVADAVVPIHGVPPPTWTRRCRPLVRETEARVLGQAQPDIVLWDSIWELFDHRVGGQIARFGTPAGDQLLLNRMEQALPRLTHNGARLVILTAVPIPVEFTFWRGPKGDLDDSKRKHLNEVARTFASRHPDQVSVIDLTPILCPGGPPCHRVVNGIDARPIDGSHFGTDGATMIARWLMPQLAQLAKARQ
jgi:peptidoglycan/LPS O-acetylase OafA/YrhL